jgi:hypothetical protein
LIGYPKCEQIISSDLYSAGAPYRLVNSTFGKKKLQEVKMWLYLSIGYCVIGFIIGINHLSNGKVGAGGQLVTIAASILLWPLFVAIK